jgi:radical SAM protein with 4Fe4S-binding SPASM domain
MVEIFITSRDNFPFPGKVPEIYGDISVSSFSRILDFLFLNRENTCLISGNEPLLYPKVDELLAITQRRRIFAFFETSGFPLQKLNELIIRYKPAVKWKIYHSKYYAENKWEEVTKSLSLAKKQNVFFLEAAFIIHDISLSYDSWPLILKENLFQKISIEILPESLRKVNIKETKKLAPQIIQLAEKASQKGIGVTLGCVIPLCIFSDAELGFLAKIGALPKRCLPYIGILPGLNIYHCRALIREAESNLSSFKNLVDVEEYFINRYRESQINYYLFDECKECFSHKVEVCMGGCLLLKKERGIKQE